MMNIKQVRYVLAVHDEGSFSAAARQQGVSVQAVSKAVGDLERETVGQLFRRTGHGVVSTQYGEDFCCRAREVVRLFDGLVDFARGMSDEARPASHSCRLVLCAPPFVGSDRVVSSLGSLLTRGVGLDVELVLEHPGEACHMLERGECRALITIGRYETPETDCHVLGSLPLGIVVSRNHPIAKAGKARLEDLAKYPVGLSPDIDLFNESPFVMCRRRGLVGRVERNETREDTIRLLLDRQGYLLSVMVPGINSPHLSSVLVPLERPETLSVPICLVAPRGCDCDCSHLITEFLSGEVARLRGHALDADGR